MAVTKEQLMFHVEVDSTEFKSWSKTLDAEFKKLVGSSNNFSDVLETTLEITKNLKENYNSFVKEANRIAQSAAYLNAFTQSLIRVGNVIELVGDNLGKFFGNKDFLHTFLTQSANGFLSLSKTVFSFGTTLLNISTSIKIFTLQMTKMGDPAIVRFFYQVPRIITPALDTISNVIFGAGTAIAQFGIYVGKFNKNIDFVANKLALFTQSTAKNINLFGQTIYKAGVDIGTFAIQYARVVLNITQSPLSMVLQVIGLFFKNFGTVIFTVINSLHAFGIALGATAFSFLKLGPLLGKISNDVFGFINVIANARSSLLSFTETISKVLISSGLSIRQFGVDIGNISGKIKQFSESFSQKNSSIMMFFAKTIGLASPVIEMFAKEIDGVAQKIAGASKFFRDLIPAIDEISGSFQFAGKVTTLFGKTIGGFGKDARNIVTILSEIGDSEARFAKGIFAVTDNLAKGTSILTSFGFAMTQIDSKVTKFIGGAALGLAVALGGLTYVAKGASVAIGDVLTKAGAKLFTFFDSGIQLAAEDEAATIAYTRAITRLSDSFDAAQSNIDAWNKSLSIIQKQSALTESDAQGFAVSIAKLGQELGLTTEQQISLAKNISIFSKGQEEIVKTTDAVRMSLLGHGKAAEELGIHVNDLAVNSGKYANDIGKTVDAMTDQEKVQARLIAINEQAQKAQLVLASSGESLISVTKKLKVAQEEISSAFAQQSIPLYKAITNVQLTFLQAIEKISQPIKNAIVSITTYSGAIIIVIGLVVKWSFVIAGLYTIIDKVNALIKVSIGLQSALNLAFTITNTVVGTQVVAVTSLGSVFVNLANLIKGLVLTSLTALGQILVSLARSFAALSVAVLTNPLFWKSAALVAGIIAIATAIKNVAEKSQFLQRALRDLSSSSDDTANGLQKNVSVFERFGLVIEKLWDKCVALAEILVGGLLAAVNMTAIGFVKLQEIFGNPEDAEAYSLMIDQLNLELADTSKLINNAGDRLTDFGGKAYAATSGGQALQDNLNQIGKTGTETKTKLEKMTDRILSGFNEQQEKLKILGTEYDRASIKIIEANSALAKALNMPGESLDKAKAIADAKMELIRSEIESEKLKNDSIKKMMDENNTLQIQNLRLKGQNIAAVSLEYDLKIKALKDEQTELNKLNKLKIEDNATIYKNLKALESAKSAAIQEERTKNLEKLKDLQTAVTKIQLDGTKNARDQIVSINETVKQRSEELDHVYNIVSAQKDQKRAADDLLKVGRQSLEVLRQNEIAKFDAARNDEILKQTKELQKSYEQLDQNAIESIKNEKQARIEAISDTKTRLESEGRLLETQKQQFLMQYELANLIETKQIKAQVRVNSLFGESLNSLKEYFSIYSSLIGMSATKMFAGLDAILTNAINLLKSFKNESQLVGPPKEAAPSFVGPPEAAKQPSFVSSIISSGADSAMKAVESVTAGISAAVPENIMNIGSEIASSAGEMGNIYLMITKAIMNAPAAILNAVDSVTAAVEGLIEFPTKLVESLGKLDVMLQKFIDNFPGAIQAAMQKVPGMLISIAEKIPDFFINLYEELPNIAEKLAEVIPVILLKLVESMPRVTAAFAKALWNVTTGLVRGFFKGVMGIMKGEMPKVLDTDKAIESIKKGIEKITKDTNKLFSVGAIGQAAQNASIEVEKINAAAKKAGKNMWRQFLTDLANGEKWLREAGGKIWSGLNTAAEVIGDWGTKIWNGLNTAAEVIGEWGTKIWNGLLEPAANQIGEWGTKIYNGLIQALGDGLDFVGRIVGPLLQSFGTGLANLVETIASGIIQVIAVEIPNALVTIRTALTQFFQTAAQQIADILSKAVTNIGNGIVQLLTNLKLPSIKLPDLTNFKLPSITLPDVTNLKLPSISLPNPEIQEYKDKFYRLGNDIWNGLFAGLNSFDWGKLTPVGGGGGNNGGVLGKVFGSTGGLATPSGFKYFANGGFARGTDTIPAMLTPGEFVIKRNVVNDIGIGNLTALNRGKATVGNSTNNVTVNLSITTKEKIDDNFVRQKLMPIIKDELKRGSLDGRAVVYAGGVRK